MSKIEVNQISSQCGATLTIGQSGDTVTLAAGATQSGFGRTGTVDWCTTAKTAPFTGVSGKGYFVNTTCGAITVTLPATPTAGDIISIKDYARTAGTNNINFCRNGSKVDGSCFSGSIFTNGESTTLIYVDGTKGWTSISDSTTTQYGEAYISATGGTISTCGDYKVHTFTADGTFCVSAGAGPLAVADYLVIAGGAGGGEGYAGGGGAGGFRLSNSLGIPAPTMSPLANPTGLPLSIQSYPITVGGGGAGSTSGGKGTNGSSSIFSTITSTGGGGGGASGPSQYLGNPGGSGGGNAANPTETGASIPTGNTPPVSPPQGSDGNRGYNYTQPPSYGGAGGGGAGAQGSAGCASSVGKGGIGSFVSPTMAGSNGTCGPVPGVKYFAGGGGGSVDANTPFTLNDPAGAGGAGGGGNAGQPNYPAQTGPAKNRVATSGSANTGGGGGGGGGPGGSGPPGSGAGGSGIVMIRYKFQ